MRKCKTALFLSHKSGNRKSNPVYIKWSSFQGDSLSALLFCRALISLITELNRAGYGYKMGEKIINHLLYKDDFKLLSKDDHELEGSRQTVKKFIDGMGMKFGPKKSSKPTFLKGKLEKSTSIELDHSAKIKELRQ